jgi:hypothetical protein
MLRRLYARDDVEVPPEVEETYHSVLAPLGIKGSVPDVPRLPF